MRVFNFLMMKVDVPIISGNFKVDFLIEVFMRFSLKVIEFKFTCHFFFLQFDPSCYAEHNLFIAFIGNMKL